MRQYDFTSGHYQVLELIAARAGDGPGKATLLAEDGRALEYILRYDEAERVQFPLVPGVCYTLRCENSAVHLAYLAGSPQPFVHGVCYLFWQNGKTLTGDAALAAAYGDGPGPYRNQYHFSPFSGWMNDPNGLCWFNGHYHLFYQYGPAGQQWNNMFWGHAASRDLTHWVHLPVVFCPQPELCSQPKMKGGAYSGSAVVEGETLYLFFTRHFGRKDRAWQREWQVLSTSRDGLAFSPEQMLLPGVPEGANGDLRDPKVFRHAGVWYMVLGGRRRGRPAVFLYKSKSLAMGWEFVDVILSDTNPAYAIAECPDLFPLENQWVLVAGYITEAELANQKSAPRDTKYYIGGFDGKGFQPHSAGILDLGRDFYAPQSFCHQGRRILFGWNSDFCQRHRPGESLANGSFSLPATLHIVRGRLVRKPVAEAEALFAPPLPLPPGESVTTPACGYRLDITGDLQQACEVLLWACREEESLRLTLSDGRLRLAAAGQALVEAPAAPGPLTLYVDRSLVEIFTGGQAATCRYYLPRPCPGLTLVSAEEGLSFTYRPARSIWPQAAKGEIPLA